MFGSFQVESRMMGNYHVRVRRTVALRADSTFFYGHGGSLKQGSVLCQRPKFRGHPKAFITKQ